MRHGNNELKERIFRHLQKQFLDRMQHVCIAPRPQKNAAEVGIARSYSFGEEIAALPP